MDLFEALTHAVFGVVNILMKVAPIGAFGAMSFTVGKYGIASLGPLAKLIATFWLTSILFVAIVLASSRGSSGSTSSASSRISRKKSCWCWRRVRRRPRSPR